MKLQKIGGYASLVQAFLSAFFLCVLIVVFPRLGLVGPSDYNDPLKGIAASSASPITFLLLSLDYVLLSIAFILIVLALRERIQANAPNLLLLSVIGASIFSALNLAAGIIGFSSLPSIASAKDVSAYRAVMGVYLSLNTAGYHALGWALLLIGWAALKTRCLQRILSYLLVLAGIFSILMIAVGPFGFVVLLLGIAWGLWLGVVLLRTKS
jgi:nitrate reductase NapE component